MVSTLHILKGLVQFLASIESAFGNFADVPSVMLLFANVSQFGLLHQPSILIGTPTVLTDNKIESLRRRYFLLIR